jgi:hypothetical protein
VTFQIPIISCKNRISCCWRSASEECIVIDVALEN